MDVGKYRVSYHLSTWHYTNITRAPLKACSVKVPAPNLRHVLLHSVALHIHAQKIRRMEVWCIYMCVYEK